MKNRMPTAIVKFFFLAMCSVVFCQIAIAQNKPSIKIGVVLSTSGSAQPYGENARRGIDLALDEINSAGGVNGQQLEIVFRDCKTDGSEAARVLRDLISVEKVQVVIGDVTSTCTVNMAPIANDHQIVLISPGASYPKLSQKGDFVFRYWYSDELEGKADAQHAKQNLRWSNVATVFIDIPYGQGINEVFVREFQRLGGKVLKQIPFTQGRTDFRDQLASLSATDRLDGVFLASYRNETVAFLKQLRVTRNNDLSSILILSTQPFNNLDIVKRAEGAAETVVFSVPRPPLPSNKVAERFRQAFKEKYGIEISEDPRDFSDTAYDSLKLVAEALRSGASTGAEVRDWLENQKGFQGAFGSITFDSHGDIPIDFAFKKVINDKFQFLGEVQQPRPEAAVAPEVSGWLGNTSAQLIATVGAAAVIGLAFLFFNRYWLWFWQQRVWYAASFWFWKERIFNRSGRKIVTLNDYVDILERLRTGIVKRCNKFTGEQKPTITIYSYTMQIPSDWPLWHANIDEVKQSPTPLERYFLGFQKFLLAVVGSNYTVAVKRVIIVDSVSSPIGNARLEALKKDVRSEYFQKYINLLHTDEKDGFYYVRQRPWPGWFTDSVFYALTPPGSNHRRWLWGVTTSYNAGEDLIILRLHRLGKWGTNLGKYLALPFPNWTMDELAEMADNMGAKELSILKKEL